MKVNDKHIRFNGTNYTIHARALDIPGKNITIDLIIKKNIKQENVSAFVKSIKRNINEWWEDSVLLNPKYCLVVVEAPIAYTNRNEQNMAFAVNINVASRKKIEMGTGEDSFRSMFQEEINRLDVYITSII